MLRLSIEALLSHRSIDAVRVVIGPDDASLYAAATEGLARLLPQREASKAAAMPPGAGRSPKAQSLPARSTSVEVQQEGP